MKVMQYSRVNVPQSLEDWINVLSKETSNLTNLQKLKKLKSIIEDIVNAKLQDPNSIFSATYRLCEPFKVGCMDHGILLKLIDEAIKENDPSQVIVFLRTIR